MNLSLDEQLLAGTEASIPEINRYFHLLEHPFLSGADFRFLFTTDQVKDTIANTVQQVFYGTHHILMSGEYGNGKTTIVTRIYALLKKDGRLHVKFLKITPDISKNALLRAILREFDMKPARSAHEAEARLHEYLINIKETEPKPILIIDEGQYIEDDALSVIHSISGLETARKKLLFMILAGQLPLLKIFLQEAK
jgi:MSHA biogenesis protein MshM